MAFLRRPPSMMHGYQCVWVNKCRETYSSVVQSIFDIEDLRYLKIYGD
jgi:hypothetical protein